MVPSPVRRVNGGRSSCTCTHVGYGTAAVRQRERVAMGCNTGATPRRRALRPRPAARRGPGGSSVEKIVVGARSRAWGAGRPPAAPPTQSPSGRLRSLRTERPQSSALRRATVLCQCSRGLERGRPRQRRRLRLQRCVAGTRRPRTRERTHRGAQGSKSSLLIRVIGTFAKPNWGHPESISRSAS